MSQTGRFSCRCSRIMRTLVGFFVALTVLFSVGCPAWAQTPKESDLLEQSGVEAIEEALPDETRRLLEQNGITPETGWQEALAPGRVFKVVFDFLHSGGKKPLQVFLQGCGMLLLLATLQALCPSTSTAKSVQLLCAVCFAGLLITPLYTLITATGKLLKVLCGLMTALTPVAAALLAAAGRGVTAMGISGVLLTMAQAVSGVASFGVAPAMTSYLAMGVCQTVVPDPLLSDLGESVKKVCLWGFSLCVTVFLGVLSIKAGLYAAADSVSAKAVRFVLGSTIPVAGSALSESVSAVLYSLSLLRKSVSLYGVVALAAVSLPLLCELLCFRVCLWGLRAICRMFGSPRLGDLANVFDQVLSLLFGLLLLCLALFVISLGVVVGL